MEAQGGARERMVMDTFVELADTLASDYDVAEFLQLLVDRCAKILGADTAGVLLEGDGGQVGLAAAVSEEMEAIERMELELGQGPCVEAHRTRQQVVAEDLADCVDRWPDVAPRLIDMGMRAGFAFPLRLRDDCIGALNLYRRQPGSLDGDDSRLAQAFADVAAIGILQQRSVSSAEHRAAQLQHALDARIVIEQAKGVLAERHALTPAKAFDVIRRYARTHNRKVRDLCEEIIEGTAPDIPID